MDLQKIMDAMSAACRDTRSDYHLTLGTLIKRLEAMHPDVVVCFSGDEGSPGDAISYRGYYSDLAFEPSICEKTVKDFLLQCRGALGDTFEGYKGGDFVMGEDTPLWVAHYGSGGNAIIDIAEVAGFATLITKRID